MSIVVPYEFDIVIYHANCYDGFTSAWVARFYSEKARFVPAKYGDKPPDVSDARVLICDFSYPRDVLLEMNSVATSILVLDHHKTAAADLAGLDFAVFDMERSGAGLTWDTLFPGQPRPILVDHVEDRDLWRFKLDHTKAVHAAMTTLPMTFGCWQYLASRTVEDLAAEGEAVLRFTQLTASKFADRACIVNLGDHQVWAVNVPVEFVSETAEALKSREPHLPILGWSWDGVAGDYYCSLRSRDDGPDVSEIAKEFGGGGHEHAAGFRSRTRPF